MEKSYSIKFFSDWHCGSGQAAGADVDLLVVKDKNGMPFIPGKTIKGLVREALEDIIELRAGDKKVLVDLFGNSADKNNLDGVKEDNDKMKKGSLFFSNAELPKQEYDAIVKTNASKYLYRSIASTAIDDKTDVAKSQSLRKMQVVVPCELVGTISSECDFDSKLLDEAFRYIKRLGQNRNRGLGRCSCYIVEP